ncbi:hypothetical protein IGI04_016260, partial [Brassica rapa subsp. trilocularis]
GYISVIQTAKCCFRFKNPTSSEKPRNIPRKFRGKTSVPRNIPRLFRRFRALLLGFLFLRKSLGIFRGNSEEIPRNTCFSSKFPRNIPRLFRGSRVFKPKTTFCGLNNTYITPIKCLRLIMKEYLQFVLKFCYFMVYDHLYKDSSMVCIAFV